MKEQQKKKYISVIYVVFVVLSVTSIFLQSSSLGDVHVSQGHELVLIYKSKLYSMNYGPIRH